MEQRADRGVRVVMRSGEDRTVSTGDGERKVCRKTRRELPAGGCGMAGTEGSTSYARRDIGSISVL